MCTIITLYIDFSMAKIILCIFVINVCWCAKISHTICEIAARDVTRINHDLAPGDYYLSIDPANAQLDALGDNFEYTVNGLCLGAVVKSPVIYRMKTSSEHLQDKMKKLQKLAIKQTRKLAFVRQQRSVNICQLLREIIPTNYTSFDAKGTSTLVKSPNCESKHV